MPVYCCRKCGCLENTALSSYWSQLRSGKPVECSECLTGKWHGEFPKMSTKGFFVDSDGFIYAKEELSDFVDIIGQIL
jgi:hypothetical protein